MTTSAERTSTSAEPATGAERTEAQRFGFPVAIALIMGSIIGVGIFNLPTSLAGYGPISLTGHNRFFSVLLVLVGLWLPAAVNISGVRNMGWVQVWTTVVKFAALAFVSTVGLFFVSTANTRRGT